MPTIQENNKRIAKNTLMLYFRMLLLMAISLYISRVVLNILGVEDYGIYNVVGGIVVVFTFINGGMTGATQRFLNVEMGRGDAASVRKVFNTAQVIHLIVAGAVLILAETVGLWFLNTYMNISAERMVAANWVYQFSVFAFAINIISVPYNACIIAHERMSAFAYISIYEALARLAVALSLYVVPFDKLIGYAALYMLVQVSVRVIYSIYCGRHFDECRHFSLRADKTAMKEMFSFSTWTIIGNLCLITHTQGVAIVANIFFGVAVNAALGISSQVNKAVTQFVSNFLLAMNPQVVKNYATGNIEQMHRLIFRGCRFAFFLVSFFVIPIVLEAPTILKVWLKIVPEYTVMFVRLVLLITLVNSSGYLFFTAQGATGKIRNYQILTACIAFCHLPLTALMYWLGYPPYYAMYVYLLIVIAQQISRVYLVSHSTGFEQIVFYREVVLKCGEVFAVAIVLPLVLHLFLRPCLVTSLVVCVVGLITVGITSLYIGMTRNERGKIVSSALAKLHLKREICTKRNNT